MRQQGDKLAQQQREFVDKLKKPYGEPGSEAVQCPGRTAAKAKTRPREGADAERSEPSGTRNAEQLPAIWRGRSGRRSSKVREALGEMQQNELKLRMKFGADWLRRGLGAYVGSRENPVTMGLEALRNQLHQAEEAMGKPGDKGKRSPALSRR